MNKRLIAFLMAILLVISMNTSPVFACNESQTNTYVAQILFGDNALSRSSDEKVRMLLDALYLCSEQSDGLGQNKLDYLQNKRVSDIPTLSSLNVKGNDLLECAHNSWEHELASLKPVQEKRKKLLRNTVNEIFDFGIINNWFGSKSGKCNSLAALLYYSHILSDYLADEPSETEIYVNGRTLSSYRGKAYEILNGGMPQFTNQEKHSKTLDIQPSGLDSSRRCGAVYAVISHESMDFIGARPALPDPVAWNNNQYPELIPRTDLYNRCHLVGRQFCGIDNENNLITGTSYLNETMGIFENQISNYLKRTSNHVVYRVTPIYKGDNKLASGVQMEAYSVEDAGKGVCFNVYCYNVQPGVKINYANGENEVSDQLVGKEAILPFAIQNASNTNPDLIFEMNRHLEILFTDQKLSNKYTNMMNKITTVANEARSVGSRGDKSQAQCYMELKQIQYLYFEVLKSYVPLLLAEEPFFRSAFY